MDRTAVATVVIGLGATIAAMVFPIRYPNVPKWAVSAFWYTGVASILIESRSRKSAQDDKWSFCLMAGTLLPANQERP